MKTQFRKLIRGQIITAQVIELQKDRQLLVSYLGDLLRVTNSSGRLFAVGDKIQLQVLAVDPLEFRIYTDRSFERVI